MQSGEGQAFLDLCTIFLVGIYLNKIPITSTINAFQVKSLI